MLKYRRPDSRFGPANKRRRYFVSTSLIDWAQAQNQPVSDAYQNIDA